MLAYRLLAGCACFWAVQEYVASTGLMEHLVEEILGGAGAFKCAASLQIDFDLLGELIKFNPAMFRRLNQLLLAGDSFNCFIEVPDYSLFLNPLP